MNKSLDFIFDSFETSNIIELNKLKNVKNIFILKNSYAPKKSFIKNFSLDIKNFLKSNKIRIQDIDKENYIFLGVSSYFNLMINNNFKSDDDKRDAIQNFSEVLVLNRNILTNKIKIVNNFFYTINDLSKNYFKKNFIKYDPKLVIRNPFDLNFLENSNSKSKIEIILKKDNFNYFEDLDKIRINLDVLTQGNFINYTLPSIGLVFLNISKNNKEPIINNFIDFFDIIISKNKDLTSNDLNKKIPLISLNILETIDNFLFNKNNVIKIKNINTNNNIINSLIKKKIEEISLNLDEIFFDIQKKNKSEIKNIKNQYIIPYKFDENKKKIFLIERVEQKKDLKNLLEHNFSIVKVVISDVFKSVLDKNDIENLNKENYKNVIACFLFFLIQFVYDIIKQYLDKISNIIIEVSEVKNKDIKKLNIKDALNYISLLNQSLYKFKLILLNNFYNFLLPYKTNDNNYGMIKNENNYLIPETSFLKSNSDIFYNFPFFYDSTTENINISRDKLNNFILNIKNNSDIYNKNEKLEFGGFCFNIDIEYDCLNKILNKYLIILKDNFIFYKFIIELIEKNFLENKVFPIELIDKYLFDNKNVLKNSFFNNSNLDILKKNIENLFYNNYRKSIINLNEFLKINKNKNKNNNKNLNNNLNIQNKKKDILKLTSRLYMFKSQAIINIVEKYITNTNLKNYLLVKIEETKKHFDKYLKRN